MIACFGSLLDDIGIAPGDILFVHSSMDWIGGGVSEAVAVIEALLKAIGPGGTLAMPSYTWRGGAGRPALGSVVDLRRSPCRVGLLPEVFRRWPGVLRSASYWVPVCAMGPLAAHLIADQTEIVHPFGPGSTFRRLSEAEARVVGLGVSLNTSSLSHLPDYDLAPLCPRSVFSDSPIEGDVVDVDGRRLAVSSIIVRPEVMARYRPSVVFAHSPVLRARLASLRTGNALFFSYPVGVYHREAVAIGGQFLAAGRLPPWMPDEDDGGRR